MILSNSAKVLSLLVNSLRLAPDSVCAPLSARLVAAPPTTLSGANSVPNMEEQPVEQISALINAPIIMSFMRLFFTFQINGND